MLILNVLTVFLVLHITLIGTFLNNVMLPRFGAYCFLTVQIS